MTGVPLQWTVILIPIPVLYTFLFSLGIGMFLASYAVFFRDLQYIYGVATTAWFFFTPIMYPVSILPERVFHLMHLNPIFHFLGYFRALALDGTIPGLWENIICLGFVLFALGLGVYFTLANKDRYILYI